MYELSFLAFIPSTSNVAESFKVTLGSSDDPDTHTTILADYPEFMNKDSATPFKITFFVSSAGEYRLAYHSYSQPSRFRFHIDNVKITEVGSAYSPGPVTDLTITPEADGALSANISFTTPEVDRTGDELWDIENIFIYRNEEAAPVHTFISPSPGSQRTWQDTTPPIGFNTYRIVASNELGNGEEITSTAYIGTDIPVAVSDAMLTRSDDKLVITWSAPTEGINGAYINPEALTYRVVRNDGVTVAEGLNALRYEDESLDLNGEQLKIHYAIYPSSVAGEGEGAVTNSVGVGVPLGLPFNESFAGGDYENEGWTIVPMSGNDLIWEIDTQGYDPDCTAQDNDDGLAYFAAYDYYHSSRLITPYINISSAAYPVLSFWIYHYQDDWDYDEDRIQVQVSADDGDFENLGEAINRIGENNGWAKYELSLFGYVDSEKIQVAFLGISDYGYNIAIDNIMIENVSNYDLHAVAILGKKRISVGEEEIYTVRINNEGSFDVTDYKVELFWNEELMETRDGITINPDSYYDMEFSFTASLDDITDDKPHTLLAKILYDEDEVADNNEASFEFTVRVPNLPEVTSLVATQDGLNLSAVLTWEAPEERGAASSEEILESFEDYEAFIIEDIGDWTLVDRDGADPELLLVFSDYPHRYDPKAYQVLNPGEMEIDGYAFMFEPKEGSGEQYLVSSSVYPATNDDWLISPLLTMEAQTVTFIANTAYDVMGIERLVFWYSTTDTHPDSFIQLSEGEYVEVDRRWQQFSYDLPEGTRHFAIQCVSRGGTMMMVDDIAFTKAIGDSEEINLLGYNIYRDGVLVNQELVTELSYTDNVNTEGTYTYKVTAVYDKGESIYSEEAKAILTEIIPPAIASRTPAIDDIEVELYAEVSVTFDKDIATNDLSTIIITPNPGNVSASVNGKVLIIAHDEFENNTTYTVSIPANCIEHYAETISWSFTTKKGVSIPQVDLDDIALFPNPAKDMVRLSNLPGNSTVTLYSLSGKALNSYKANDSTLTIPLQLESGVYLIRIESNEQSVMKKLIIE